MTKGKMKRKGKQLCLVHQFLTVDELQFDDFFNSATNDYRESTLPFFNTMVMPLKELRTKSVPTRIENSIEQILSVSSDFKQ